MQLAFANGTWLTNCHTMGARIEQTADGQDGIADSHHALGILVPAFAIGTPRRLSHRFVLDVVIERVNATDPRCKWAR